MTHAAANIAVRCQDVVKSYGEAAGRVQALRGINLEVRFGELLMLVGPSGSGKTTLLSVIAGLLDPDEGECQVLDHSWRAMDRDDRARFRGRSIGFVFQAFNLLSSLTASENVAIPLIINGTSLRDAQERAEQALGRVGLGARASARPGELSGGQQQRVAIARALVHDPKLIVCDEPTSNLDHVTGGQVMDLLRGQAQAADRSLIVVTHDSRIFGYADRIAHMEDGAIERLTESEVGVNG